MDEELKINESDELGISIKQSDAPDLSHNTVALVEEDEIDPLYHAKAQILNDAIQEIGMGKYQWHLFCVAGFGWLSDNVLLFRCFV
jgi:hypothetical protein